jgi:hypothetical protein
MSCSVLTSQPPCGFSRGHFEADEDGVGVGGRRGSGDGEGEASCRGGESCYGLMEMEMEMEMDCLGGWEDGNWVVLLEMESVHCTKAREVFSVGDAHG